MARRPGEVEVGFVDGPARRDGRVEIEAHHHGGDRRRGRGHQAEPRRERLLDAHVARARFFVLRVVDIDLEEEARAVMLDAPHDHVATEGLLERAQRRFECALDARQTQRVPEQVLAAELSCRRTTWRVGFEAVVEVAVARRRSHQRDLRRHASPPARRTGVRRSTRTRSPRRAPTSSPLRWLRARARLRARDTRARACRSVRRRARR